MINGGRHMRVDDLTHAHAHTIHRTHPQVQHGTTVSTHTMSPARTQESNGRGTPLRVDAQRNLEHVLRAAREVFGESGYGAPMEDVARRARVGVGTVYRRFPSKDVLVQRIAREETARLAEQARAALRQEGEAWPALARFLRTSVASGAGRLLPPSVLEADRSRPMVTAGLRNGEGSEARQENQQIHEALAFDRQNGLGGRLPHQRAGTTPAGDEAETAQKDLPCATHPDDPGVVELLWTVGQLVDRAREAGKLRADVTVGDILLVIATGAPSLPDVDQRAAASTRLLDILLEGLRGN